MILVVAGALKPQIQAIAGLQLKVIDGLLRDKNAVGCLGKVRERLGRIMIGKIGVRDRGQLADRRGIDPEDVLQVRTDIGEAMHHRFCSDDARQALSSDRSLPAGWPVKVTSAPLVSSASTRDCALYVLLKMAVAVAKANARATSATPLAIRRRWRDKEAAMTGASAAENGARKTATKLWPGPRVHLLSRSHSKPAPIQRHNGARKAS